LCEKIIQCEEKEVAMIIDEIIDLFVQFFDSMKEIHQKSYEFLISINKSIIQETNDEYDSMINFLDDFQYIESVPEIKNYMKENLKSIMEKISQSKMDRIGCLIERSCEYIEENYMKDITLEDMANKIGFSSYYFSKLFKIYKKMNFIDYLTSVRVKKAKSFLKEPNKSIKEISNLVGYSNSNYFTRVFKRIEKVTPTEYRNKIMLLGQ
jgi:two-component system response regulator YesN